MALHLFGYDLRAFARDRQSRFFTLVLPVLFLVIFASVFGGSGNTTTVAGGPISTSVYHVPGGAMRAGRGRGWPRGRRRR
jgi:ABC-2 type transport system permease protein